MEEERDVLEFVVQVKMVEAGVVYRPGDLFDFGTVDYDRLVFLLGKEWLYPLDGYQSLPEPLFSEVRELRG